MSAKQLSDYLVEPMVVGGLLAGGTAWWWGANTAVTVAGNDVRLWMLLGGLGVASTIAMNAISNTINPDLPDGINFIAQPLEAAAAAGGNYAMLLAAETAIAPAAAGETFAPLLGIAAVATLGGKFITHEYLKPWLVSMKGGTSHY